MCVLFRGVICLLKEIGVGVGFLEEFFGVCIEFGHFPTAQVC